MKDRVATDAPCPLLASFSSDLDTKYCGVLARHIAPVMVTATETMLVRISHGEHDMRPGAGPVHKGTDDAADAPVLNCTDTRQQMPHAGCAGS
jgi:hypothetical protein